MARQEQLLEKAKKYLVGTSLGMFNLPPEVNMVISHGKGSKVFDTNGKQYVDFVMGSGPLILGHAHPSVVEADCQVSLSPTKMPDGEISPVRFQAPHFARSLSLQ
jgi:glutamate-1-semialdehyde aminotransferase